MRILGGLAFFALFFVGCSKPEDPVDYRPPITAAVGALKAEMNGTNYIVLVVHPATRSLFTSTPASTNVDLSGSLQKFADDLRLVDVTHCPEDFRETWIKMVHTIENYPVGPDPAHGLASGAAGAGAIGTGSKEAGDDLSAREFQGIMAQYDIKSVLQDLETVSLKYDVQPSLVKSSPAPNH